MSLETRLIALAEAVGTDVKGLRNDMGSISSLTTAAKNNIVAAINEINQALAGAGVQIDDNAGTGDTGVVFSASHVISIIEAAKDAVKSDLLDGAPEALDTLVELAAALGNDPNFATSIAESVGKRVRFDEAQTLTANEKKTACQNIGVGDPEIDLVAKYNAKKA